MFSQPDMTGLPSVAESMKPAKVAWLDTYGSRNTSAVEGGSFTRSGFFRAQPQTHIDLKDLEESPLKRRAIHFGYKPFTLRQAPRISQRPGLRAGLLANTALGNKRPYSFFETSDHVSVRYHPGKDAFLLVNSSTHPLYIYAMGKTSRGRIPILLVVEYEYSFDTATMQSKHMTRMTKINPKDMTVIWEKTEPKVISLRLDTGAMIQWQDTLKFAWDIESAFDYFKPEYRVPPKAEIGFFPEGTILTDNQGVLYIVQNNRLYSAEKLEGYGIVKTGKDPVLKTTQDGGLGTYSVYEYQDVDHPNLTTKNHSENGIYYAGFVYRWVR